MRYEEHMRRSLCSLTVSRITPYCGIAFLLALVAHKQASDLACISYVLAIYSVLVVMASMPLAATGNLIAEHIDSLQETKHLFRGGFSVSIIMAVVALCISCVMLSLTAYLPGARMDINKVQVLACIYIGAIPLLVINTFLHFFHEASGAARLCSLIKAGVTVCGCTYLCVALYVVKGGYFIYWAMGYFLLSETLLLIALLRLSKVRQFGFSPRYCVKTVRNVIALGVPIALGLSGQKLYFYLLSEKLATLMSLLVAQLSIYMSVLGLIMIPVIAYCQGHSLYISRHAERCAVSYLKGQAGLLIVMGALIGGLWATGHAVFFWLGGEVVVFDREAFLSTCFLFLTGSTLTLSTAHLRGLRDTLAPQLMMNMVMLSVLVPIIYFVNAGSTDIHFYLRLQSAGLLTGFIVVQLRIWHMHLKPQPA